MHDKLVSQVSSQDVWRSVVGQGQAVTFLQRLSGNDTLSHAYLFVGPQGVGKRTTAKALAASLGCQDSSVLIIEPQGRQISVEQVRSLQHSLIINQGPLARRVIIVDPADSLGPAAGNALLKSLEEPPDRTYFVLIAESPEAVLPTIRSRCQTIRFGLLAESEIASILASRGVPAEDINLYSRAGQGRMDRALQLAEDPSQRAWRLAFFEGLAGLATGSPEARVSLMGLVKQHAELATSTAKGATEEESAGAVEFLSGKRGSATIRNQAADAVKRAEDRAAAESATKICQLMASWYLDLLSISEGDTDADVRNPDALPSLRSVPAGCLDIRKALSAVRDATQVLGYNVEETQVFESLFFKLSYSRR